MSPDSLAGLIEAHHQDEAVALALHHRLDQVAAQLGYTVLQELGGQATEFIGRWLEALPPLERLQAAEWACARYVLAQVDLLDQARRTGAEFLQAQAAAVPALASTLRQVEMFNDGPDAELHPSVVSRSGGYADQIDTMTFEFVPLDGD